MPECLRDIIFLKRGVKIPEKTRCCSDHMDDYRGLNYESFQAIKGYEAFIFLLWCGIQSPCFHYGTIPDQLNLFSEDFSKLLNFPNSVWEQTKCFDFDNPHSLVERDYLNVLGLRKSNAFV